MNKLSAKKHGSFVVILIVGLILLSAYAFWHRSKTVATDEHGPHGGNWLEEKEVALEWQLDERNMPAHFIIYVYRQGQLVKPERVSLDIILKRFDGRQEKISFLPQKKFLISNQVIEEPHSFDMQVNLSLDNQHYQWNHEYFSGRVEISPVMQQATGIEVLKVQSQIIQTHLNAVGKITPNRDTMAPIYARYPGIIKSMTKKLGEEVEQGERLATIESNESLQNYVINSPVKGTIVQKNATNGELTQNTKALYEIANLTDVWADFTLYRKDAPLVKTGMEIIVSGDEGTPCARSTISYISPLGIEDSQTILARTLLSNEQRQWLPGMYVNGAIIIHNRQVPRAIKPSAIQIMDNKKVVFVRRGDEFEATPVLTGAEDNEWVEILSGLSVGQEYVSKNSFYLKAELGKNQAKHEH